ncbi:MAG: hypothetical protein M0T74_09010 [Desulfitobacterium hafniense]|jgi:hypothetical protein|nr:hypothetical protein [Desulfitobacterium hafniense]
MQTLFWTFLILVALFGFAVSGYVTFYKIPMQSKLAKMFVFLIGGALVSVTTLALSVAVLFTHP